MRGLYALIKDKSIIYLLISCCILCLSLSGCDFSILKKDDPLLNSEYLNHDVEYKNSDDRECLKVLIRLLEAVDKKDINAIKEMFSKEALKNIDDLDEKIEVFINTFPTWECKYDSSFGGMGKHANKGKITKWIKPTFDFESEGRKYVLKFVYYTEADENSDQLGLSMVQIFERYAAGYDDGFEAQGEDSPQDIYLWDYTMDLSERKPIMQMTPFGVYEKTDEEKYEYIDTMTPEEVSIIVRSDNVDAYYSKKLYSYQINDCYVSLKELRYVRDYFEKNNVLDLVVFEGVQVNYLDNSLLNNTGPDLVYFHLENDKWKNQLSVSLVVNGDEVTIVNEDKLLEQLNE